MTWHRIPTATIVAAVLLIPTPGIAQAQPMPELTEAQLHARAAMNAMALWAVTLADERARGVSPAEWGLRVGEQFAASWGAEQTTRSLARGMWVNILSLSPGVELELGELTDDVAEIRMPADFPAALSDPARWYGMTRDDYLAAFEAVAQGIAARFGMRASLDSRPDAVVLAFRR